MRLPLACCPGLCKILRPSCTAHSRGGFTFPITTWCSSSVSLQRAYKFPDSLGEQFVNCFKFKTTVVSLLSTVLEYSLQLELKIEHKSKCPWKKLYAHEDFSSHVFLYISNRKYIKKFNNDYSNNFQSFVQ